MRFDNMYHIKEQQHVEHSSENRVEWPIEGHMMQTSQTTPKCGPGQNPELENLFRVALDNPNRIFDLLMLPII